MANNRFTRDLERPRDRPRLAWTSNTQHSANTSITIIKLSFIALMLLVFSQNVNRLVKHRS